MELKDVEPALDELQVCARHVEEARAGCLQAVNRSFDGASEIAATIALRLQHYRDASSDHDPELVKKAESVEEDVSAWMPVLVAVRQIVGKVSADRFLAVSRVSVRAIERHRATVNTSLGEFESIVTFTETLAAADTLESRLEFLGSLSTEELERIRRSLTEAPKRLHDELATLQDLLDREIVAEAAIAEAFDALRQFVEARAHALRRFIEATDYFRDLEPAGLSGRDVTAAGLKEGAKVAFEFTATKIGPKMLEQIPIIGTGIAFTSLVQEMREKTKELRRRAEELRQLATAHVARGETDEIFLLGRQLSADVAMVLALKAHVDELEQWLGRLVEGAAWEGEGSGAIDPTGGS